MSTLCADKLSRTRGGAPTWRTGGTASGRPRLVDVAARAGVSTATASLVLRGRPGPSAGHGGCRARGGGRRSATGPTAPRACSPGAARHLLGVLLDVTSPFHAELVRALDTASGDRGLDLVLGTTTARTDEHRAAETLLDFRCEALVLLGPQMTDADLTALATSARPWLSAGRATAGVTGVLAADDQGLEAAVDHLVVVWGTTASRSSTGRAAASPERAARATATRWRGTASAPGADVLRGGITEADGRPRRRGCSRGRRVTGPRPSSPSTTGWRSACATACCGPACGCPRTSPSSATTTARSRGSARSTSPR